MITPRGPIAVGAVLLLAVLAAVMAAGRIMQAPPSDVEQLALILFASGAASLLAGGAAVHWGVVRLVGLRVRLAVAYAVGLLIALANVIGASALMFLNTHDLALLFLLLAFATAISLSFGYSVATALTRDLEGLSAATTRLAEGDLSVRVRVAGSDEVARLGDAFDRMAERIESAFHRERALEASRRDLVALVSHDLRTPLATTRAMIEAVADGVVSEPSEVRRYLGLMRREIQHLARLIDDLFELSQIESGALQLRLEPVVMRDLLGEMLAAYEAQARAHGVVLERRLEAAPATVLADPARLQRVVRNLVDNALLYSPVGGRIGIQSRLDDGFVDVAVTDDGPGVPVDERDRIFERFYRADRPRAAESVPERATGAGLGLAIARGLVHAHGGKIWVESTPAGGAAFHFTLPRAL